jgi:hypothetical protein
MAMIGASAIEPRGWDNLPDYKNAPRKDTRLIHGLSSGAVSMRRFRRFEIRIAFAPSCAPANRVIVLAAMTGSIAGLAVADERIGRLDAFDLFGLDRRATVGVGFADPLYAFWCRAWRITVGLVTVPSPANAGPRSTVEANALHGGACPCAAA